MTAILVVTTLEIITIVEVEVAGNTEEDHAGHGMLSYTWKYPEVDGNKVDPIK